MARRQQRVGKHGENLVGGVLSSLGLLMVERIGNPYAIVGQGKRGFEVVFTGTASGDFRAVTPCGASVLVEVKTVLDGNLTWSHLREHQPVALTEHARIGEAVSMLVWVHSSGVYVMRWTVDGIDGFSPRHGLTPERAAKLDAETRGWFWLLKIGQNSSLSNH